jgi:hypothetical protein
VSEWRWLEDALGERVERAEPVAWGSLSRDNAWRVETRDGRRFAVKRVTERAAQTRGGFDALTTEWEMLRLLQEMARRVPTPVAWNADDGYLVTTWVDGETLDDLAQRAPTLVLPHVSNALEALDDIERAFDANIVDVEPFAFQLDYDAYLSDDFAEFVADAVAVFDHLMALTGLKTSSESSAIQAAWDAVYDEIREGTPTFGALDYNARNLLVDGSRPTFLDFSAVGWDWPERRIAQYFVALGAHHPDGNFVQTVTRATVDELGDRLFFSPRRLDAHLVVFLGVALERLSRNGLHLPYDPGIRDNRTRRFDRLLELLASGAVSDFAPTAYLRECIAPSRYVLR